MKRYLFLSSLAAGALATGVAPSAQAVSVDVVENRSYITAGVSQSDTLLDVNKVLAEGDLFNETVGAAAGDSAASANQASTYYFEEDDDFSITGNGLIVVDADDELTEADPYAARAASVLAIEFLLGEDAAYVATAQLASTAPEEGLYQSALYQIDPEGERHVVFETNNVEQDEVTHTYSEEGGLDAGRYLLTTIARADTTRPLDLQTSWIQTLSLSSEFPADVAAPPTEVIPLPSAAGMGLVALVGLGLKRRSRQA